jgi:hypothetical protein
MPLDGSMDWENAEHIGTFILKMYCEADGLQGLCKPCHTVKTMNEDEMRKHYRQVKKDEIKKKLNEEAKAKKEDKA